MADVVHLERIDLMERMLDSENEVDQLRNPTIYRPSRSLTLKHSNQYLPRYIALGLYNQDIDVKESACATIDRNKLQIKLEMGRVFKRTVRKSWAEICQFVVEDPEDMKRMYDDCPIHDVQAVRNILTLDAVFVTCVLHTLWDVHRSDDHSVHDHRFQNIARVVQERGLAKGNTGVLLDILAIFHNQIPFVLIKKVVQMMYPTSIATRVPGFVASAPDSPNQNIQSGEARILLDPEPSPVNGVDPKLKSMAAKVLDGMVVVACGLMIYYLPGRGDKPLQSPPPESANYRHLLDCVYKTALQYSTDSSWEWPDLDNDDTPPVATATQLRRAGIKIVRGADNISNIRFERGIIEATLVLPQLTITPSTEILLRNLVAYESRVLKKGDLMCYLSFMDQLIDTEHDVLLLKERKLSVIESQLSSDSEVAGIFNSLLSSSSDVPLSRYWADLRKQIHEFYSSEKRQLWVEFYESHFGRPWITASVVAAMALLVLTFLQTLYTMKSYYEAGVDAKVNGTN